MGKESTAQVRVTATAMPTVRKRTVRYSGLVTSSVKLLAVNVRWTSPVNSSRCHSELTSRTASEPRYATTSQATGPASNSPRRTRGRDESQAARRRRAEVATTWETVIGSGSCGWPALASGEPSGAYLGLSALDLGEGLDQVIEPLAGRVGPAVDALGLRRLPVPHGLPVPRVGRVERVAVGLGSVRDGARLAVGRRLAEPLRDLVVHARRHDVVEPLVGAVEVGR